MQLINDLIEVTCLLPSLNTVQLISASYFKQKIRVFLDLGMVDYKSWNISPCFWAWALSFCMVSVPADPQSRFLQGSVGFHSPLPPLPPRLLPLTEQWSATLDVDLGHPCAPVRAARGLAVGMTSAWIRKSWQKSDVC